MFLQKKLLILSISIALFLNGCNSGSDNVTLPNNQPPIVNFTFGCSALTCSFSDTSTDSDGTVVSWQWDFGDGNNSTTRNPIHTFTSSGTYNVVLSVRDNDNASGTHSSSVDLSAKNSPPIAAFTFSCTDLECSFSDTSTDSDGNIIAWDWDFGDGDSSINRNPTHVFSSSGAYSVTLTVTDDNNSSAENSKSVQVKINSVNIAGDWTGGWRDTTSSGTFTLKLTQASDDSIFGTYSGSDQQGRSYYGTISGNVAKNVFSGKFDTGRGRFDCSLFFAFTATVDAFTMTADYSGGSSCERSRSPGKFTASRR